MKIDHHFIREKVDFKEIVLSYIRSEDQVTNMFIKGLLCREFEMYAQFEGSIDDVFCMHGSGPRCALIGVIYPVYLNCMRKSIVCEYCGFYMNYCIVSCFFALPSTYFL